MRWRERRPCRNLPFFTISVVFCTVCLIYFFRLMLLVDETPFQVIADDSIKDFFVNTSGCQIPAWDPWDDSVKVFYEPTARYKCTGQPSVLRVLPNSVITLDVTMLRYYYEVDPQSVSCVFQEIFRDVSKIDEDTDNRIILSQFKNLTFDKALRVDFIKTVCNIINSNGERQSFNEFLPLTPLKTDVEYRSTRLKEVLANKPLNVIFLGLDSISHLNFLRHFPKCQKFFSNVSTVFNMQGYTKVGDNTFPNLVPLLTGHFHEHYYDEANNKTMFFDDVDFVWKFFSRLGYRTFLAEDAPDIATFNYYRSGFRNPPTDYYYRPFALAVEKSDVKKNSKTQCFGSKMEMEVIYDYLKSFVETLGSDRPFFAFTFLARLTHDFLNYAGYADDPTYQLLQYLDELQIFQNTLVVFFSDHGIRYGPIRKTYIGQFEERMPFMNIFVPNWFLEKYKTFDKNLNINSKRLTTPFDIHATLLHLASIISGDEKFKNIPKHGISLFQEVPSNRTCSRASITPHWCPCQRSNIVSKSDLLVKKASLTIIDAINNRLSKHRRKCALLSLDEIFSVRQVQSEHSSISPEKFKNYLITLSVHPSDAVFEATVKCENTKENSCKVIDEISRINAYGAQSICIASAELRKFCYCLY